MISLRYLAQLDDGTQVLLRNIIPQDKRAIQIGVNLMSHRTRYQRFFSGKSRLSESQLDYLTHVDGIDHVGLFAMTANQKIWDGFGIARFIRNKEDSTKAEVAITLMDEHQGKGLGSLLMDIMMALANERGIQQFTGYVLPENKRMVKILQKKGAHFEIDPGPVFLIKLNIPESKHLPQNVVPVEYRVKNLVA